MACTRKTKTLVSTCVILSGMTNIVCLLYVGWVTNYIANIYIKVPMPLPEGKFEGDKRGDTIRIMERLDRLENVVNQHIQGKDPPTQTDTQIHTRPPSSASFNALTFIFTCAINGNEINSHITTTNNALKYATPHWRHYRSRVFHSFKEMSVSSLRFMWMLVMLTPAAYASQKCTTCISRTALHQCDTTLCILIESQ